MTGATGAHPYPIAHRYLTIFRVNLELVTQMSERLKIASLHFDRNPDSLKASIKLNGHLKNGTPRSHASRRKAQASDQRT